MSLGIYIGVPLAVVGGIALCWAGASALTGRYSVENASYKVVRSLSHGEVRYYPPQIAARVLVQGVPRVEDAQRLGFRKLAGFIFGKNIAPTSSVSSSATSASIAMTSPVITSPSMSSASGFHISFVMPSKYTTVDSLPRPLDPSVEILSVPGRYEVADRATGVPSSEEERQHRADALYAIARKEGLTPILNIAPRTYLYDPPWTPYFFRRSDVAIEVEDPNGK